MTKQTVNRIGKRLNANEVNEYLGTPKDYIASVLLSPDYGYPSINELERRTKGLPTTLIDPSLLNYSNRRAYVDDRFLNLIPNGQGFIRTIPFEEETLKAKVLDNILNPSGYYMRTSQGLRQLYANSVYRLAKQGVLSIDDRGSIFGVDPKKGLVRTGLAIDSANESIKADKVFSKAKQMEELVPFAVNEFTRRIALEAYRQDTSKGWQKEVDYLKRSAQSSKDYFLRTGKDKVLNFSGYDTIDSILKDTGADEGYMYFKTASSGGKRPIFETSEGLDPNKDLPSRNSTHESIPPMDVEGLGNKGFATHVIPQRLYSINNDLYLPDGRRINPQYKKAILSSPKYQVEDRDFSTAPVSRAANLPLMDKGVPLISGDYTIVPVPRTRFTAQERLALMSPFVSDTIVRPSRIRKGDAYSQVRDYVFPKSVGDLSLPEIYDSFNWRGDMPDVPVYKGVRMLTRPQVLIEDGKITNVIGNRPSTRLGTSIVGGVEYVKPVGDGIIPTPLGEEVISWNRVAKDGKTRIVPSMASVDVHYLPEGVDSLASLDRKMLEDFGFVRTSNPSPSEMIPFSGKTDRYVAQEGRRDARSEMEDLDKAVKEWLETSGKKPYLGKLSSYYQQPDLLEALSEEDSLVDAIKYGDIPFKLDDNFFTNTQPLQSQRERNTSKSFRKAVDINVMPFLYGGDQSAQQIYNPSNRVASTDGSVWSLYI